MFLALLTLPISIFAQTDPANDLWRERARSITEDLIVDGAKLPPLRRAVLRARLAEHWSRYDRRRALGWLTMAVESVEQIPDKENWKDRSERLETTSLLLKTALRMDRKLSQRLIAILTNEDNAKGIQQLANADSLITAAASIVDVDSTRAAELGALALRLGPPSDVATLLFPLYRQNVRLADQFLAQSMAVARQPSWPELLNSLTYVVFAKERGLSGELPPVPESARKELLQLDIAYLNARQDQLNWSDVLSFITPVLSQFERLIPQQAGVARQAVNQCQTEMSKSYQQLMNNSDKQLNTVDALLKAAADAKEPIYRATFEYRAANLARSTKDYDLAMKILDGMSKESRELMGGAWETYRWDWPAEAALHYYTDGRVLEMNLILDGVPADWQAFAKASFLDRLPDRRATDGDPALQFLNDARGALRRSKLPDSDKYGCYFVLLRLVVKYDPAAASTALKEAIASLNRADQKDQKTLNSGDLLRTLPAPLLEMDEFAVKDGLASISSVETRAQLRLDLLQATLGRIKTQ